MNKVIIILSLIISAVGISGPNSTSPGYGGSGGQYDEINCGGYHMYSMEIYSGNRVDSLRGGCQDVNTMDNFNTGRFGGTGGYRSTYTCPAGYIKGFTINWGAVIDAITIHCFDNVNWYSSTRFGGNGGYASSFFCPAGEFVSKITGRTNHLVDFMQVHCSPLY